MYQEFYSEREVKKTRKNHHCEACGSVILEGSNVLYCSGKADDFWTCYLHKECMDVYRMERDGGDYYDGLAFADTYENVCFWGEHELPRLELMKKILNPSKFLLGCIEDFEENLKKKGV